ncbi:MAG: hypothetical protein OXE02_09195 [Chloroflexi bacterium]|nr:hypothetical protein [Chloroflexota bacterium]
MPRFLVTYRWELWLLLWTPLLSVIASVLAFSLYASLYDEDRVVPRYVSYAQGVAASLVHAGLLAVFYARIRRLEHPFFTLVWGYAIWLAAVGALVWLVAAAFAPYDEDSGLLGVSLWTRGRSLAHGVVALLPLLWFARQASRLSLAHACFLFLVLKAYTLTIVVARALNLWIFDVVPVGLLFAMTFASVLGFGFLLAWLLGNFDVRGIIFRRQAVGWLLAAHAVSVVWELQGVTVLLQDRLAFTLFIVDLILPLALIYFVHVRHPEAAQQP